MGALEDMIQASCDYCAQQPVEQQPAIVSETLDICMDHLVQVTSFVRSSRDCACFARVVNFMLSAKA